MRINKTLSWHIYVLHHLILSVQFMRIHLILDWNFIKNAGTIKDFGFNFKTKTNGRTWCWCNAGTRSFLYQTHLNTGTYGLMFTRPMNRGSPCWHAFPQRTVRTWSKYLWNSVATFRSTAHLWNTAHFHLLPQWVVSHAYCHVSVMQDLIARILTSSFTSQLRNFCERWFRSWNYYYMADTPEYSITSLTKWVLFTGTVKTFLANLFSPTGEFWGWLIISTEKAVVTQFPNISLFSRQHSIRKQGPKKSKNANTQWRCFAWGLRLCPSRPSSPLPCREPKGQTGEVDACLRNGHMNKHKNTHTLAVHNFLAKTHLMRQKCWCSTLTNVPACPHFPSVGGGALSLRNPVPTRQARIYSLAFGRFPFPSVRPLT